MSNNTTNYPQNTLLWTSAVQEVASGFSSLLTAYSSYRAEKSELRRQGEMAMRQVRLQASRTAASAAAMLSVASIDISKGTARNIINRSIIEANKEVSRIAKGLL